MFQLASTEDKTPFNGRNGSAVESPGIAKLSAALQREPDRSGDGVAVTAKAVTPVLEAFEEVYAFSGIRTPGDSYSILKVVEMLNSRHLAEMTPESKRNSLMMALEAAAVEIGDLLRDAVARNRALDEYEEERR